MGKMIVIGGGYNGGEFDKQLEGMVRNFLRIDSPKVIFVPYASDDFKVNYKEFKDFFETLGCKINLL